MAVITLQDCINAYSQNNLARLEKQKEEEQEQNRIIEENTRAAFESIGLEPYGICGSYAYFNMDGLKVTLVARKWKYGQHGFFRVLDETCGSCGQHYATDEMSLDMDNIGLALVSPQKRYHDCPNWDLQSIDLPVVHKSAREQLIDALDAYLDSRLIQAEI